MNYAQIFSLASSFEINWPEIVLNLFDRTKEFSSPKISFYSSIKTALGMSFISMISMEVSMNITDLILTGGAMLTWWVVPIMLIAGFYTPLPYNYWKLKKYNVSCH